LDISAIKSAPTDHRWVGDLPELGDVEVFVCSINHPAWRRHQQRLLRGLPPAKRKGGIIDPVDMDRIQAEVLLRVGLKDWRNLKDGNQDVVYSPERAEQLLSVRAFRDACLYAASQVESEDSEADEALEKN